MSTERDRAIREEAFRKGIVETMPSDEPFTVLALVAFVAIREYRLTHYASPTELGMSEATLIALAAECGMPVDDDDALRTADGKLLFPTPPMFAGLSVSVDDALPFGTIQTRSVSVPVSLSERPTP